MKIFNYDNTKQKIKNTKTDRDWLFEVRKYPIVVFFAALITGGGGGYRLSDYLSRIKIEHLENKIITLEREVRTFKDSKIIAADQKRRPAYNGTTVLQPTWVYENLPIYAFDDQVLIRALQINAADNVADFSIFFPDKSIVEFKSLTQYDRKEIKYSGKTFYFDLIDTSYNFERKTRGALIKIVRKTK